MASEGCLDERTQPPHVMSKNQQGVLKRANRPVVVVVVVVAAAAVVVALFLACEDSGRIFDHSYPAFAFFFFFRVESSSRTLIPLFMPGSVHSGSAS